MGVYCFIKTIHDILERFSKIKFNKNEFFENLFNNLGNYLNDHTLFVSDLDILEKYELQTFFLKGLLLCEEGKSSSWVSLTDYVEEKKKYTSLEQFLDVIFENSFNKKKFKKIDHFKINKKKKIDSMKFIINIFKEYVYLNFIY